jgi:hypothetical protein
VVFHVKQLKNLCHGQRKKEKYDAQVWFFERENAKIGRTMDWSFSLAVPYFTVWAL